MQRIDENTYIDDTLVTCAEYQLFIDEMREQGKYYQPDHWATYQFPKGRSKEPILGVRHSDAVEFCEWLTQREAGKWRYRLPTNSEAVEYSFKSDRYTKSFGYWSTSNDGKSQFTWLSTVLNNYHWIDIDQTILSFRHEGNNPNTNIDRILNRSSDSILHLRRDIISFLDFVHYGIDEGDIELLDYLSTLVKRIEGNSAAFEGIRLVKYRE